MPYSIPAGKNSSIKSETQHFIASVTNPEQAAMMDYTTGQNATVQQDRIESCQPSFW